MVRGFSFDPLKKKIDGEDWLWKILNERGEDCEKGVFFVVKKIFDYFPEFEDPETLDNIKNRKLKQVFLQAREEDLINIEEEYGGDVAEPLDLDLIFLKELLKTEKISINEPLRTSNIDSVVFEKIFNLEDGEKRRLLFDKLQHLQELKPREMIRVVSFVKNLSLEETEWFFQNIKAFLEESYSFCLFELHLERSLEKYGLEECSAIFPFVKKVFTTKKNISLFGLDKLFDVLVEIPPEKRLEVTEKVLVFLEKTETFSGVSLMMQEVARWNEPERSSLIACTQESITIHDASETLLAVSRLWKLSGSLTNPLTTNRLAPTIQIYYSKSY